MLELLAIQIGLIISTEIGSRDDIDYREKGGIHLQLGADEFPFYGWGSATTGENYVLGQKISSVYNLGIGVGYNYNFNEDFYTFIEAGIGYPHNKNTYKIQQEVAYTYLVGRHAVDPSRPPPVDPGGPYQQDHYATTWDIDYGFMARAGVGYNLNENFKLSLSYKYFNPKGIIEIYDEEARAAGLGWWQEYVNVNMNAAEFGLHYEF